MPWDALRRVARERSRESVQDLWRDHKGFIAWWALVIFVAIGQIQLFYLIKQNEELNDDNQAAIVRIDEERSERINTQASINAFFCQQNNEQDQLLGRIFALSLEDVNVEELTAKERRQLKVFEAATRDLTAPTDCKKLAIELARAAGIDPEDVRITPLKGLVIREVDREGNIIVTPVPATPNHSRGDGSNSGGGGSVSPGQPKQGKPKSKPPKPKETPAPTPAPAPAPEPAGPAGPQGPKGPPSDVPGKGKGLDAVVEKVEEVVDGVKCGAGLCRK